jgi:DNA-binding transcriptional LysR family regulator
LLPALLSLFRQKHPHIRVRAAVSDSMAVMAQVERGEVSLGLVGRKADRPHLEFRHLSVYAVQKELQAGQLHALTVSDLHYGPVRAHHLIHLARLHPPRSYRPFVSG